MARQHPCSVCSKPLKSDDRFDLVLSRTDPKVGGRYNVEHMWLCHKHGLQFQDFMKRFTGGDE